MARWWRHILIGIASLAVAFPLRIRLELGHGSSLPIVNGSALAKGGDGDNNANGGDNGNDRGNGGGGNAGNQGHASGGTGKSENGGNGNSNGNGGGHSNAGGLGGDVGGGEGRANGGGASAGGGVGAGKGDNNAGGNSSQASSGTNEKSGSNSGLSTSPNPRGSAKVNSSSSRTAPSGSNGHLASDRARESRNRAAASPRPPSDQTRAVERTPTAGTAAPVRPQPVGAVSVPEDIDRRPKPRRSTRFIVASGLSPKDLATLTARGFRIEDRTQGSVAPEAVRLRVPGGLSVAQARQRVRLVDARAAVDFDQFYYLDDAPPACMGAACQVAPQVDWASLVDWSGTQTPSCGPVPLIGMIDTDVNVNHAALKEQAIEVIRLPERHAVASLQDHGTAVAALLAGNPASQTPGLLPQAKIIAVDAFYRDGGTADRTDVMTLVAAIEALAERGVRIMNMSLSGPSNEVLAATIAAAQAKGIVIVAAAGNNGAGAEPSYPAAYPGVVAVTAVDHDLNVYRRATRGSYVDLSAPGVNVWTAATQGGGMLRTGTSYAVPFVSAAASLVLASHPELDAKAVQTRLEERARDLGQPGRDPIFGFGLIQMAGLCTPPEPPAIATSHETQRVSPVSAPVAGHLEAR